MIEITDFEAELLTNILVVMIIENDAYPSEIHFKEIYDLVFKLNKTLDLSWL